MPSRELVIYGAGGFAREVAWLAQDCDWRVVAFIDDDTAIHGTAVNGILVDSLEAVAARHLGAQYAIGVGDPKARELLAIRVESKGLTPATLVHPRTARSEWVDIGAGTVICAGNILTTNITLGRHVQVNLDCTIGHDVVMKDFATLAPGVHVSGCVHILERAYIGTGAVIVNGTGRTPIIIGADAVVGAGACVTKNVAPAVTVVGVPARPLQR